MRKYKYSLIPPNADIRILRILAGSGGEIACELKPVNFGSLPYLALSYVWGNYEAPTSMPKIKIQEAAGTSRNHRVMDVRPNLFGALEQLRHPTQDVDCWADAICIDFENVVERESQLALMHDIYQRAERVMHWLGRQEKYTVDAFSCIKLLREPGFEKELIAECHQQLRCFQQLLANVWFSRRWIIQEVAFARTAVLFSGPCSVYWSVFREAAVIYFSFQDRIEAMQKSPTGELCGYSTQAAKVLIDVINSLSRQYQLEPWERLRALNKESPSKKRYKAKDEDGQPEARNVNNLSEEERTLIEEYDAGGTIEYQLTLEELIDVLYPHEVSDYRDTIYAVLSLAKDTNRRRLPATRKPLAQSITSPKDYHNIQPDYSKDVFEVYKDFTEYCTQRQSMYPLDIICRPWVPRSIQRMFAESEPAKQNLVAPHLFEALRMEEMRWVYTRSLASWMPTTERLAFDHTQSPQRRTGDSLVGPPDRPIYRATKSFTADISFGESMQHIRSPGQRLRKEGLDTPGGVVRAISDGTLSAKGIQLDIIDILSSHYEGIITEKWLLIGGWSGQRSRQGNQQPLPDALWRTMVADRDLPGGTSIKPEFREACKQAIGYRDEHNNICTSSLVHQGNDKLSKFLKRVNDVAWNRRLFRTEKLKRLGLGPLHAAERDILCVLYGCSVPVVLRALRDGQGKETGEYRLIGECYLDGMMDGEAVSESHLEQSRIEKSEKIFVLR